MFHHLTFMAWDDPVPDDVITDAVTAGRALAGSIESIRSMSCGPALPSEAGWDAGFEFAFDSKSDYERFAAHPAHQDFVDAFVHPYSVSVLSVDYDDTATHPVPGTKGEEK